MDYRVELFDCMVLTGNDYEVALASFTPSHMVQCAQLSQPDAQGYLHVLAETPSSPSSNRWWWWHGGRRRRSWSPYSNAYGRWSTRTYVTARKFYRAHSQGPADLTSTSWHAKLGVPLGWWQVYSVSMTLPKMRPWPDAPRDSIYTLTRALACWTANQKPAKHVSPLTVRKLTEAGGSM